MLPYFNQLRQAAMSYQLGAAGSPEAGGDRPPPVLPLQFPGSPPFGPFGLDPLLGFRFGPGARFMHEEPKPQHSYIGLIAMAILSNPEHKMVLSDIYQWILDNYPYFRTRGPGWRNSIRHNLSLNDCFVKSGRSANGKGHYWAIHPANVEDFKKGDFRRRRAQRKVRKHMGLSVPDEEEDSDDSPVATPSHQLLSAPPPHFAGPHGMMGGGLHMGSAALLMRQEQEAKAAEMKALTESFLKTAAAAAAAAANKAPSSSGDSQVSPSNSSEGGSGSPPRGKRQFDMESLLAPETRGPAWPLLPFWPLLHQTPAPAVPSEADERNDAAQWQETFAKIMARSYAARKAAPQDPKPEPKLEPAQA